MPIKPMMFQRHFVCLALVFLALAAMYAASLADIYVFADETRTFGKRFIDRNPFEYTLAKSVAFGRPLQAFIMGVTLDAVRFGEAGVMALRWLSFFASFATAAMFYWLLTALGTRRINAVLITVLVWSHPAFAMHHVYTSLVQNWVGMVLSLLALVILIRRDEGRVRRRDCVVFLALFLAGFLIYQMTPFFAAGMVGYAALVDRREERLGRYALLVAMLIAALFVYSAAYFAGKHFFGLFQAKSLGLRFTANYFNLFEFWNYLWPVRWSQSQTLWLKALTAAILVVINVAALTRDLIADPGAWRRWGLALLCLGTTLIPIVADASGRQHLYPSAVVGIVLMSCYSLGALGVSLDNVRVRTVAVTLLLLIVLGAGLSYQRALVAPSARMLTFVQDAIARQMTPQTNTLIVIRTPRQFAHYKQMSHDLCDQQPCSGFYGRRSLGPWHMSRRSYYKVASRLAGFRTNFRVQIAKKPPADVARTAMVVDWNRYLLAEFCRGPYATGAGCRQ